jgi:hypothetical protein
VSTLYLIHVPRLPVIPAGLLSRFLFTVGAWWALRPHRRPRPARSGRHRRADTAVVRREIRSHRRRPTLDDPEWGAALQRIATRMAPHYRVR